MINLPTKFEVSIFSRYGDMKFVKNAQNGGDLGCLGVTQGHRQCRYSIERIYKFSHFVEFRHILDTHTGTHTD